MGRRILGLALVAAAVLPLGGCFSGSWVDEVAFVFGATVKPSDPVKAKGGTPLDASVTADVTANFGGLSGTYDVTLDNPSGGTFGHFSGTGTLKRGRFVTLKDNESADLFSTVDAMLSKALGGENVTVTKAKAKVVAYQTPGGVEKHFAVTISFAATIDSGIDAGSTVKGKINAGGQF